MGYCIIVYNPEHLRIVSSIWFRAMSGEDQANWDGFAIQGSQSIALEFTDKCTHISRIIGQLGSLLNAAFDVGRIVWSAFICCCRHGLVSANFLSAMESRDNTYI
jgi:hypothetical protein